MRLKNLFTTLATISIVMIGIIGAPIASAIQQDYFNFSSDFSNLGYQYEDYTWGGADPIINFVSPTDASKASSTDMDLEIEITLNDPAQVGDDIEVYVLISPGENLTKTQFFEKTVGFNLGTYTFSSETEVLSIKNSEYDFVFDGENTLSVLLFDFNRETDTTKDDMTNDEMFISYPDSMITVNYELLQIYRLFSPERKAHAYLQKSERDAVLATDPAWTSDLGGNPAMHVSAYDSETKSCSDSNAIPVHRFYSSVKYNRHFYTTNSTEVERTKQNPEWDLYDGIVFCAFKTSTLSQNSMNSILYDEVYRFWNLEGGGHFYTANMNEYYDVKNYDPTWSYEQVAFASKYLP